MIPIKTETKFDKFFNTPYIQKLQDDFAIKTGVASLILDLKGTPYTQPSNFAHLCDMIRATPKGRENCRHSDVTIGKKANYDAPHIQPCLSGGLWDAGAGLYVGKMHVANWFIGQIMNEAQDLTNMMKYARLIEADTEQFSYALTQVTIMTEEQFTHTCQALYVFSNALSECAAYEKDLPLSELEAMLADKKTKLIQLIELETALEPLMTVWDEFEYTAKQYQLVPC